MRFYICLFFLTFIAFVASAQQDTLPVNNDSVTYKPAVTRLPLLDSVAQALAVRQKEIADSLAILYVKKPDPGRINLFVDSVLKSSVYKGDNFLSLSSGRKKNNLGYGHARPSRDVWVIGVIIFLLLFTAVVNIYSNNDVGYVFQSLFSVGSRTQGAKEDAPVNTWSFIGLFLLFGFTSGIFLYLLTTGYYKVYYPVGGIQLFFTLSLVIIALFAGKFLVLKFLGFIFDINKLINGYISVLSLTYFNVTFVFLPVAVCFSLIADKFIPYLLVITLLLVLGIFIWQYVRSSVSIISTFRFHKFYLFLYLCALEICPILILIKALNIGFR
ncbi:DUF4271 domain-containing protein [Mucilaginibacter segetis]|uniref:DUF4271 domain-containing protein n=1 Tax=Mucilaginibacter segetis TaxID=2793071 RepID=A0A934UNH0_9SPHI|nr:DUF4271 domain-containing protein [Mucilaginibacter segetis]MBK0380409.1 DUF4271 domain-containing protein [Mucilaginibacter segetis]